MNFVFRLLRFGLDALGDFSLWGLSVAERKSWRLPLLWVADFEEADFFTEGVGRKLDISWGLWEN